MRVCLCVLGEEEQDEDDQHDDDHVSPGVTTRCDHAGVITRQVGAQHDDADDYAGD